MKISQKRFNKKFQDTFSQNGTEMLGTIDDNYMWSDGERGWFAWHNSIPINELVGHLFFLVTKYL